MFLAPLVVLGSRPRLAWIAAVATAGMLAVVASPAPGEDASSRPRASRSAASSNAADRSATPGRRLREGSRIENVIGVFRPNGDVATMITEEGLELGGLPNLNLERVVKLIKSVDEPESVYWSVSGVITEFSGRNYLLITRAVFKAAAPPPAPEVIAE